MWVTIIATVLEILAPVALQLMRMCGTSEERQKAFQEWVASMPAKRAELKKIKDAATTQAEDIAARVRDVSPR